MVHIRTQTILYLPKVKMGWNRSKPFVRNNDEQQIAIAGIEGEGWRHSPIISLRMGDEVALRRKESTQ